MTGFETANDVAKAYTATLSQADFERAMLYMAWRSYQEVKAMDSADWPAKPRQTNGYGPCLELLAFVTHKWTKAEQDAVGPFLVAMSLSSDVFVRSVLDDVTFPEPPLPVFFESGWDRRDFGIYLEELGIGAQYMVETVRMAATMQGSIEDTLCYTISNDPALSVKCALNAAKVTFTKAQIAFVDRRTRHPMDVIATVKAIRGRFKF